MLSFAWVITGTPFALHYESGRLPGYQEAYQLEIPLTGPTIKPSLRRVAREGAGGGATTCCSIVIESRSTRTRGQASGEGAKLRALPAPTWPRRWPSAQTPSRSGWRP